MLVLRPYQEECVSSVISDLKDGHRLLGVIAPCSYGKTISFIEICKRYLNNNPNKSVLVLSTLGVLTDQTFGRFSTFAPELKVGILQADQIPEPDCQVVIGTVQSSKDDRKILKWFGTKDRNVGLIIGDEIHNLLSTKRFSTALALHPECQVIGFSASYYRKAQVITNLFDKISYQISSQELIDNKWLVPVEMRQVLIDKDTEFEKRIATFIKIHVESHKGQNAFVFCHTIEEAESAALAFNTHGINAAFITGDVTGKLRRDLLDDFEKGELEVLTTCDVLSQGVDSQRISVEYDVYGTQSPTLFIQRSGRLARTENGKQLSPEHTKQKGIYYTAASAPQIKSGYYKNMLHYSLNEGNKKLEKDVFSDLEYMKLLMEPPTSQIYKVTEQLCKIAEEYKKVGMLHIYDLIRTRKIPARFMKKLDLVLKASSYCKLDTEEGLDKALTKAIKNDPASKWIIPHGRFTGWHVKDLPYYYKEWLWRNANNGPIYSLIEEWKKEQNKPKQPPKKCW